MMPPTDPVVGDLVAIAAMRIWNDPDLIAQFQIGTLDVSDAVAGLLDKWLDTPAPTRRDPRVTMLRP